LLQNGDGRDVGGDLRLGRPAAYRMLGADNEIAQGALAPLRIGL
jgi:hypothetical protein